METYKSQVVMPSEWPTCMRKRLARPFNRCLLYEDRSLAWPCVSPVLRYKRKRRFCVVGSHRVATLAISFSPLPARAPINTDV